FILLLVALPLASATLSDCEQDFLKKCRKCDLPSAPDAKEGCPIIGYDCEPTEEDLVNFNVSNGKFGRDCDSLVCVDKNAEVVVEGVPYKMLACADHNWLFGKHFSLKTGTAGCYKKCTNCYTFIPPDKIPEDRAQRPKTIEPVEPTIGTPCTSAVCPEGYEMYGIHDGEEKDIDGIPTCTGDRTWNTAGDPATKYTTVYCKPTPEG
ncbi:hypothetical protein PENTCL1PPCAC_29915, partial [Pristionchus entomophagus]